MLNVTAVFEKLELGTSSITAVQQIRRRVEEAADIKSEAQKVIYEILGLKCEYDNDDKARLVAEAIGDEAFKVGCQIDDENAFLHTCEERISKFMLNPKNAWMFAKAPLYQAVATVTKQVNADVAVQVEVKADGSIKKGGKEQLVFALYQKFVLDCKTEDALDNQGFIALCQKPLDQGGVGISKPCATTYTYNAKKKLGEPTGGIKRSKKGRKKK